MRGLLIFFALLALCLALAGCASPANSPAPPRIEHGAADLRSTSVAADRRLLPLAGQWSFAPEALIDPAQPLPQDQTTYIPVPASWNTLSGLPGLSDGTGFGTYRLRVRLRPEDANRTLGLVVEPVASAYRLWVNGRLLRSVGTVGESARLAVPRETMEYVYFVPGAADLQIDLQVSNFSQRKGGIWNGIDLGSERAVQALQWRNMIRECVSVGALLMMGAFYLVFALLYIRERSTLYLGIFSILVAIRVLFLGQVLIAFLFPHLVWAWQVKLEYGIEVGCMLSFNQYIREIYPKHYPRKISYAAHAAGAAIALTVLLTPSLFFTRWMIVHVSVLAAVGLYTMLFVYPRAIRGKELGARSGLAAFLVFSCSFINDTVYYLYFPFSSEELVAFGFFCYLVSQMAVTIRRYVRLKKEAEELSARLAAANRLLEQKVEQRTRQLTESYRAHARFMHGIAHDLRAPLSLIRSRSKQLGGYVLPEGEEVLAVIEQHSEYAAKLAHNLNDLASLQENELKFQAKPILASELMRRIYKRTGEAVRGSGLRPAVRALDELFQTREPTLNLDMHLLERVTDNLISNALKYAPSGSEIRIGYRHVERRFEVSFENDVDEEPEAPLERMFERFYRGAGASGDGSGIGLTVSREIVRLHGGDMRAEQSAAGTVRFLVELPAAEFDGK